MFEFRVLGNVELYDSDGVALNSVLAHPKRVALLAYLALARPRWFHRRDALVALLWPELTQANARAALRKAVHFLRQSLGETAVRGLGEEEVGLAIELFRCDAVLFEELLSRQQHAQAMALYRGDLLPAFHIPEASGFEHWVDGERERLRRMAVDAVTTLAHGSEAAGDTAAALEWARQAVSISGGDELALLQLLQLLDRSGDRVGALRTYDEYCRWLTEEYEISPSSDTQELVQTIRDRMSGPRGPPTPGERASPLVKERLLPQLALQGDAAARSGQPAEPGPAGQLPAWPVRALRSGWVLLALAALSAATIAIFAWTRIASEPTPNRVLAVGEIRDYSGLQPQELTPLLRDMLSTNLARVEGLNVVSNARMYELLGPRAEGQNSFSQLEVAKRAGATELIDAALYQHPDGRLRLDLRRVAVDNGALLGAARADGADLFHLVDQATSELAAGFDRSAREVHIADVTTRSLVAYRLYELGLREYYQRGDVPAANRLFRAALADDSAFAMAAHYAWLTRPGDDPENIRVGQLAVRLANRATDRERLAILVAWNREWQEPVALALAETLVVRFPQEPDAWYSLGRARVAEGEFPRGISLLQRVVAMDSSGLRGETSRCQACDALGFIVEAYQFADSFAAAERVAREYVRLAPNSAHAWGRLFDALLYSGRHELALSTLQTVQRLHSVRVESALRQEAIVAIHRGSFGQADSLLARVQRDGSPEAQSQAAWFRQISLRQQGRLRLALSEAREAHRRAKAGDPVAQDQLPAVQEAQALFELGQYRAAAALFDSVAAAPQYEPWMRGKLARHRVWYLTHVATALAAGDDTVRLAALADSIEAIGLQSSYGRDRRLHHYVRGLLLSARGRTREAEASFRRASFSPTFGYTRVNFELARLLLGRNRPADAVAALQPALRGGLEGSNLYITRTEIHELLARAFEAAGQSDSAADHYRHVAEAWRNADPHLQPRRAAAARKLSLLAASAMPPQK